MDRITLTGMRFEGRHGVSEEERLLPQLLEVDLELEADLEVAGRTDELSATIDYGPLIALVRDRVEGQSFRLLEGLASAISDAALASAPRAEAVVVRVRKSAVPVDADLDHAQVELRRARRASTG